MNPIKEKGSKVSQICCRCSNTLQMRTARAVCTPKATQGSKKPKSRYSFQTLDPNVGVICLLEALP